MHKPISIRLIIALAAIVYCVPANPLSILPGSPLGILGGLVLIVFIAVAISINRAVPGRWVWLGTLAALAIVRYASGALAPDLGWSAAYLASDDPSRPIERSTEISRPGSTRIDRALDFDRARFPVHFFNDIRRFNYYRPTDIARDTMPFGVSWTGVLVNRPVQAASLALLTNGPASVQIGDQPLATFPSSDTAQEYVLPIELLTAGSSISVSYTRPFEVSPILKLLWLDGDGRHWAVGAPEIAATPRDRDSSWLSPIAQWTGTLTSLALLSVIAAAFAASRAPGTASLSLLGMGAYKWRSWEYAFLSLIVLWAAIEPVSSWLSFNHEAILLSGGNDWLAYESFARDIQINGLLMNNGRPPGTGEAYYYQPAYAYALGVLHRILGESLGPVLWWQHASLGFAAMLVYGVARRLWGPVAAVIAALLVMYFRSLELSTVSDLLLSENLLFLVLPGMLWLFVRAYQQPSLASVAWAGAALGLAGLTRSTPLLVLPFALIGLTLAAKRAAGWRRAGFTAAVFLLACFAVVSLATIRNLIVSGKPTLITTSAGANLIEAHRPSDKVDLKGVDQNRLYDRLGFDRDTRQVAEFIRQDPGGYFATLWPTAAYAIGYVDPILPGRGVEWPLLLVFMGYAAVTITVPSTRRVGAWLVHAFILTHWAQTAVFFSHQYGFRLPLPMYLPMMAVIGGGIAALLGSMEKWLVHPKGARQQLGWSAIGALGLLAAASVAASWTAELERAPERLYTLEGDVGRIARAIRYLPDEQRPSWAYGTGNDTRTREIAYLRGLAFPLIKWIDSDRGMVFPAPGHTGILGAPIDGDLNRLSACLRLSDVSGGVTLHQVSSPRDSRCFDVGRPSQSEFEYLSRLISSSAPSTVRAGERFSAQVTWEVVERPVNRYRPIVELVGPDDRVVARGESNPYGADLWSPAEIITSIHELAIEPNVAPGPYTLTLSFTGSTPRPNLADPRALLYRAPLGTMTVEPPIQTLQPAQLGVPIRSPWTLGSLQILGASITRSTVHPGDPLELSLAWQSAQASPQPIHLSAELVGALRTTLIPSLVPLDGRWPLERWRRAEATVDRRTIVIPNDMPAGNYQLQVRDTDRAEAAFDVGDITIEAAQRRMEPLAVRAPSEATLGATFRLVGYDLRNRRPDAGESVDVGLTWQALTAPPTRYVVVVSLIDAETNRVVARRETEPSDAARPTTGWSNGEYVVDNHRVRTSRDLPRGRYRVRIDMVDRDTGSYLLDANGTAGILLPPEVIVE